jgi:hypothetical protein
VTTTIDHTAIANWLNTHRLVHGLGSEDAACSIASINLALTGELTDKDPSNCMSPMIREWVIRVQDKMPEKMMSRDDEHGRRWRQALPLVAGSLNPDREQARLGLILEWMWERLGDDWETWVPRSAHDGWRTMLTEQTSVAARTTSDTADASAAYAANAASHAAYAANAASHAAYAANAACAVAYAATNDRSWHRADPARLLAALVMRP